MHTQKLELVTRSSSTFQDVEYAQIILGTIVDIKHCLFCNCNMKNVLPF